MDIPEIYVHDLINELSEQDLECLGGRLFEKRDQGKNIRFSLLLLTAIYYNRTKRRLNYKTDARFLVFRPPEGLPVFRADEKQDVRERIISQEQGPDRFIIWDTRTATRQMGGSLE